MRFWGPGATKRSSSVASATGGPWRWPGSGMEFFGNSEMFAIAYETDIDADTYYVQIKAKRPELFEPLRPLVRADHWDNP